MSAPDPLREALAAAAEWDRTYAAVVARLDARQAPTALDREALLEAAEEYDARLKDPTLPWDEQPSRLARSIAHTAHELRARAERIGGDQ